MNTNNMCICAKLQSFMEYEIKWEFGRGCQSSVNLINTLTGGDPLG